MYGIESPLSKITVCVWKERFCALVTGVNKETMFRRNTDDFLPLLRLSIIMPGRVGGEL